MKLKKFFLWTLAATMAVSGPVFVTSCTDNNDNPVSTENDDEMPDVEVTPTTDQLTVTSNKTLYILYGYHPNKSTVGKDCIISHLLARFSDKKIVTNEASIADMKEGDYMLLYLEDPATADNEELRDATRKFINQGGIVMFAETPAVNMETLLNHGSWEELPVMPDDQNKLTDPVHVYFYPTYCPTFYNAKFDNFNTDQSEDITDYWLGKFAYKVITETEKWVEEAHNNKPAQARTRRNSEVETYVSEQNRAMHISVFGSYYFPNDFVRTLHYFFLREHLAIGILGGDVAARHANLRKHLTGYPALKSLSLWKHGREDERVKARLVDKQRVCLVV